MKQLLKNAIFGIGLIIFSNANGQKLISEMINKNISEMVNKNVSDANKIASAYAGPALGAMGNNLNNGWYSTADPLKLGRFKLELNLPLSFPSESEKNFKVNEIGLYSMKTNTNEAPTAFGSRKESATFYVVEDVLGKTDTIKNFTLSGGGLPLMPMINPQLNVGLVFGTELMFRYLPSIDSRGFKTNYWGLGVKHDIKQWIPIIKQLPFSLSFIGAFSNLDATYTFADALLPIADATTPFVDISGKELIDKPSFKDQKVMIAINSWNANVIISKKLPLVSFFGGLRLSHTSTSLSLEGNFPLQTFDIRETAISNTNFGKPANTFLKNPLSSSYNKTSFGINGGTRIKLGIISILLDGTYVPGGFSSATAGFGIGFFN